MEKVTIVMPIYRPEPRYLEEQLRSLNGQSYEALELLVWNDCPGEEPDRALFEKCVTHFPVRFAGGENNIGYVGAFGKLTELAEGDYISYCDQDDVWMPDKVEKSVRAIRGNGAVAAVCDRSLTDGDGKILCKSARHASREKRMTWNTGEDITRRAAFTSYCTGMTLTAKRREAQRCLPFVPGLPHDQQLVFLLSATGKIAYIDEPLVRHRRYGTNASGTLAGVECKQDYYRTRCAPVTALIDRFEELYPGDSRIPELRACAKIRIQGSAAGLIRYRDLIPDLYKYECALALCPDFLFRKLKNTVTRQMEG